MHPSPRRLLLSLWVAVLSLGLPAAAQQLPTHPGPQSRPPKSPSAPVPDELGLNPLLPAASEVPPSPPRRPRPAAPPAGAQLAPSTPAPPLPAAPLAPGLAQPPLPTEEWPSTSTLLRERYAIPGPAAGRQSSRERAVLLPAGLQRHPGTVVDDEPGYTLRTPSAFLLPAQLSLSVQNEIRYSNNVDNVPERFAREDTVVETTPQLRLQLGSTPGPRLERTDDDPPYYLQLDYLPTIRSLLGAGTVRTLQRVRGEAGRATPLSTVALRFEYDENLFGLGGLASPEESFTLLEIAPLLEYRPTVKSLIRALGTFDRIRVQNNATDRADYSLDLSFSWEPTASTLLGTGLELRHISFEEAHLGTVDYQYSYLAWSWKPTAKLTLQTRGGVERRSVDRALSGGERLEPGATVLLNWLPSASTRVNAGLRIRNQPSVTGRGELFQDVRFGLDATHDLTYSFYLRGELILRRRDYGGGRREEEFTVRPAVGYRPLPGRLLDTLRVEIFYQHRTLTSTISGGGFDQNTIGLQSLVAF